MSLVATPWGYDVELDAGDELDPIIDLDSFHEMTGNRFIDDARIETELSAASSNVRDHCGWHLCGELRCVATLDGGDRALWLPSTHVVAVESVEVLGTDVTDLVQWSRRGELRIPRSPDVLGAIVVRFTSGFGAPPGGVANLVKDMVEHRVTLPYGIQQETAGSVSVSYSVSASGPATAMALTPSDIAKLSAYRLSEVR